MKINIVSEKSQGLINDGLILEKYIQNSKFCLVNEFKEKKSLITIHIETINTKIYDISKFNLFMINHEFFSQDEYLDKIYMVICKTQAGYDFIKAKKPKCKVLYTKFTSLFPETKITPDYNLYIHPAGSSYLKGTDFLMNAWKSLKNPPKLYVLCREKCEKNVKYYIDPNFNFKKYNIELVTEKLEYDKLINIKQKYGIHLCPSLIEGYGHYINEARMCKALILTLDAPPMNELIDSKSGVLVKAKTLYVKTYNGVELYQPEVDDFREKIEKIINMSESEKQKYGENAYKKYKKDMEFFEKKISKLNTLLQKLIE